MTTICLCKDNRRSALGNFVHRDFKNGKNISISVYDIENGKRGDGTPMYYKGLQQSKSKFNLTTSIKILTSNATNLSNTPVTIARTKKNVSMSSACVKSFLNCANKKHIMKLENLLLSNLMTLRHFGNWILILSILMTFLCQSSCSLLTDEPTIVGLKNEASHNDNVMYNSSTNRGNVKNIGVGDGVNSGNMVSSASSNGYLDKLDNLERSVAAVLIKVAYGTTSTTKRSIPDNSYVPSLTTVATPLLTTLRYLDKSSHQQQHNLQHRNYELDLERDHALPTSAPNADILKSNSNPTYPNPNRHHGHDRERHRHPYNSTPMPSLPNLLKKTNGHFPTVPMYPGELPSYSPPSRSFFTPPLPPEYQNPFADKPTLRGTNNEGIVANTGTYINRRPIPPPSLMPGHERIPFRPPDLAASIGNGGNISVISGIADTKRQVTTIASAITETDRKKALNTPSRVNDASELNNKLHDSNINSNMQDVSEDSANKRQEVLPSIRRILSGSNGKKGDIPEVLLKQVTNRPISGFHQPPSSPVVLIENTAHRKENEDIGASSPNINKSKLIKELSNSDPDTKMKTKMSTKPDSVENNSDITNSGSSTSISSTPSAAAAIGEATATSSYTTTSSSGVEKNMPTMSSGSSSSTRSAAAAVAHSTWTIAWNIHVYLSVILFTILAVYSFYKMLTYNKLTHLFSQSYFLCIHFILIIICISRIFYLCYDAYNIHASFHIFVAELLLNLPATFLTVSFSVLILFLFLKSLNHKNNRYSALIRPLTVVVGCGVHVVLCITLHYVESYTLQNQYHFYHQQQQQQFYRRQQQIMQQQFTTLGNGKYFQATVMPSTNLATPSPPPRVLTLICQIIYIFICLSLGLLYLYLYRILKRILRSKSQNYIHGYQNLSYAIHITIATALLFVLLAALQIFGAISISTARPIIVNGTAEIDWLQWGYQFSLRLIEIAIITLISWVTGLKVSSSGGTGAVVNGDMRAGSAGQVSGVFSSGTGGLNNSMVNREKHSGGGHHSNVANFFLPCTSSSSQEQFDTDYPAICNANTNLHTYTMRTGKLIYDDSYALNSLGPTAQSTGPGQMPNRNCSEYQMQHPTYQRPYDTGSMHSAVNHNLSEYSGQGTLTNHRYHQLSYDQHHYQDYMTDATTDHYENPNFDLRGSSSGAGSARSAADGANNAIQKIGKNSTSSATALSSGGSGSSAVSQHQMLLLQSDSCYSEPLQENSSYEFNNFERPTFDENGTIQQPTNGGACWPNRVMTAKSNERKTHMNLERGSYENPERRSSNSTNSCTSNGGTGGRYASYNSFDRGYYNGVRKSGTLNNIVNNNSTHERTIGANNMPLSSQRASGVQTMMITERQHHHQRGGGGRISGRKTGTPYERTFEKSSCEIVSAKQTPQQRHLHNSEDEEDDMISGSNVECTNLINNEDSSCNTNSSNSSNIPGTASTIIKGKSVEQGVCLNSIISERLPPHTLNTPKALQQQQQKSITLAQNKHSHATHVQSNPITMHHTHNKPNLQNSEHDTSPVSSNSATSSSASDSMLVTEQGFLRFRALDDINNAQGVGIHNASIRKQGRGVTTTNPPTSSINC